jgi:hypothetical protein
LWQAARGSGPERPAKILPPISIGGKNKCSVALICRVMAAKFANLAKSGNVVARIYNAVAAKI